MPVGQDRSNSIIEDRDGKDGSGGMPCHLRHNDGLALEDLLVTAGWTEGAVAPDVRSLLSAGDIGLQDPTLASSLKKGTQNLTGSGLPMTINWHFELPRTGLKRARPGDFVRRPTQHPRSGSRSMTSESQWIAGVGACEVPV